MEWRTKFPNKFATIQGPNERFEKFSQQFQKTWSMIKDPLLEAHVKAMFLNNIYPKLKFIAMD